MTASAPTPPTKPPPAAKSRPTVPATPARAAHHAPCGAPPAATPAPGLSARARAKALPGAGAALAGDPRWQAVLGRDRRADGSFVYGVRTTGIYCRPSCPARRPRPENVTLFDTPRAAEAAGLRPCRRCHPSATGPAEAEAALIAAACRMIEAAEAPLTTAAIARRIGLSRAHLHRRFVALTGMTPGAYGAAHRAGRLRAGLGLRASVTEAIHAAGFGAASSVYREGQAMLGMTPGAFRKGGAGVERIAVALAPCWLGMVLVAATGRGVCAILLGDRPEALMADLAAAFPKARLLERDARLAALLEQVLALLDDPGAGAGLPLDIRGTAFQQRVWQALRLIAPGETVSYAELARRIGAPAAVRAVAGACAANRLAVAIPCHRVLRSDGGLAGYRWGTARKQDLLAREGARAGNPPGSEPHGDPGPPDRPAGVARPGRDG